MAARRVASIIWDFDGTLADTLDRNLQITRRIVERLTGGSVERIAALRDREAYGRAVRGATSWRELYVREFGLPFERTVEAAVLWTTFHDEDEEAPPLFDGIADVVDRLADRLQGIVSQNGRANIAQALGPRRLLDRFRAIVADEDLPFERQKPEPDGLLQCAAGLHGGLELEASAIVLYIGDHPVDVECVRRAGAALAADGRGWRVVSVGVEYGGGPRSWPSAPDHRVSRPAEILDLVAALEGSAPARRELPGPDDRMNGKRDAGR
jgi:phosphoglycolate phosphatase-like HAD superfamily hydrolase